jgi:hypothetical protein
MFQYKMHDNRSTITLHYAGCQMRLCASPLLLQACNVLSPALYIALTFVYAYKPTTYCYLSHAINIVPAVSSASVTGG